MNEILLVTLIVLSVVGPGTVLFFIARTQIEKTRQEQERHRREFEQAERVLGPIMKQWKEELRALGLDVPPGTKRM